MRTAAGNPYAEGTPEHALWAHWHRAYFDQPVAAQLADIQSSLRQCLSALFRLNVKVVSFELRQQMRSCLLQVEENVNLLDEVAEHELARVVSRDSDTAADGSEEK